MKPAAFEVSNPTGNRLSVLRAPGPHGYLCRMKASSGTALRGAQPTYSVHPTKTSYFGPPWRITWPVGQCKPNARSTLLGLASKAQTVAFSSVAKELRLLLAPRIRRDVIANAGSCIGSKAKQTDTNRTASKQPWIRHSIPKERNPYQLVTANKDATLISQIA